MSSGRLLPLLLGVGCCVGCSHPIPESTAPSSPCSAGPLAAPDGKTSHMWRLPLRDRDDGDDLNELPFPLALGESLPPLEYGRAGLKHRGSGWCFAYPLKGGGRR